MRKATDLGVKELVLPLYYLDVPELNNQATNDELVKLLQTFQWADWRELRFSDVASAEYRRAVAGLAARIVEANHQADASPSPPPQEEQSEASVEENEAPGQIDSLAETEEVLAKLPETLGSLSEEVKQIGQLMNESTDNIKRLEGQRKGFSARLAVARQLSSKLNAPVENIWTKANLYASQIHSIDTGFRIIIERAPIEVQQNPEYQKNFCSFFGSVRGMSTSSAEAITSVKGMLEAVGPLEKMSRDMRPVLRRLKQGLTILIESSEVTQEWLRLIDSTEINCENPVPDQQMAA
jgi:hypothetical protein